MSNSPDDRAEVAFGVIAGISPFDPADLRNRLIRQSGAGGCRRNHRAGAAHGEEFGRDQWTGSSACTGGS